MNIIWQILFRELQILLHLTFFFIKIQLTYLDTAKVKISVKVYVLIQKIDQYLIYSKLMLF